MYTVVIDESGDVGLQNVQSDPSPGPTQYFCMCATIFNEDNRHKILADIDPLRSRKGEIHASKMSHFDKVNACRILAQQPIGMVGVMSNKLSLLNYLTTAQKTNTHYYNKVTQYLLERVGEAISTLSIPTNEIRICIEAREQQYSSLLSFIKKIQETPLDTRATHIKHIDRFSITAVRKVDDPLMALSDIGANAIFSAIRRDERMYGLSEMRYLRELRHVFLCGPDGNILPKGLKPIHSIGDLGLPQEVVEEFSLLINPRTDYRRFKK